MAGNEWVIKVSADVKEVLDASRKIGQAGKQAGQEFQQGFAANDKLLERLRNQLKELSQGTSSNATSLGALKAKLGELNQTLDKAAIGSKEFVAAQKEIAKTQQEINSALRGFAAGEATISGLRSKMAALNETLDQTVIGSKEFVATQKEIAQTRDKLNATLKGFQGNEKSIEGLNNKLAEYNKALQKAEVGSKEFIAAQKGVAQTQQEINSALKGFDGNEKSIRVLRERLLELNQTLERTAIGSKEFVAAQKQIALTQREVESALGGSVGVMNTFGQALKGAALQAAAFFGLYEAITFVSKAVIELDSAAAAVRTLGVDSKELSTRLLDLSIELGNNVSQADLLKASYDVASSGFSKTAEIVDILKASALGATGGFSELTEVAKAVTAVLNSYGLTAADAEKVVDSFVQTQNDGVITVKQFGDNIGNIAAVAAAAGIPLSELSAAISTATLKGVPVEQTFTGLRQAISSIIKPSDQATAEAERLGISYNLAGLKARGFSGFLADVVEKSKGSADSIAILTGSVEAQAPIQQIVNDGLKAYTLALDNQTTKSGQAAKASEIASETIATGFLQVVNATKNFAATINTALPGASSLFGDLAKVISVGTRLLVAAGPAISKSLSQAFAPLAAFSSLTGFNKLISSSLDWLLKVTASNKEITAEQVKQAQATDQNTQKKKEQANITQNILDIQKEQNRLALIEVDNTIALSAAKDKLSKAQTDSLVSVQQASISLGQALISLEDSRFGIIKSRNDFELKDAQERKASEQELDEIKRRGEEIEAAAMSAKFQGLVAQQGLERDLLALKQQQALTEANSEVRKANAEYKKAELEVTKAINESNKEAEASARANLEIKDIDRQIANENLGILQQIQPIQGRIADATNEEAINRALAAAEAKGLQLAADGTFKAAKGTADQFKSVGDSLKVPLSQQGAFAQLARDVGLRVRDTGRGYYEIGQALGKSTAPAANDIKNFMVTATKATGVAKNEAAGLASNMRNAANSASAFYNSLNRAAGLPPARFTGGPVDAGQTYRVNDGPSGMSLGQEAFLSASGALSLINRPLNSLWTAPSRGTVIPAAVTSRLKDSGVLGGGAGVLRGGSDPAVAHLALAVGNLSQEVAELRRKAWNVSVGVRGDGSGLKLAQTMARMR
jgi:TP901 family phage tail tape measure protein